MTLRTVTYDDSKFKIVPLEPSPLQSHCVIDWNRADKNEYIKIAFEYYVGNCVYKLMVAAAPEYQEPVKAMICRRCGADRFKEHCKQPDFGCPMVATAHTKKDE